MGVRKNYRNLTDAERDRFVQALNHVKSTGLVDQFAEIHARHFNMGIHRSSHFLPWHREMILRFERELQAHHPDITLPYWDSPVDRSTNDPLWNNNFLGQFNSAWNLRRALGSATLPTTQQVETNQGRGTYDAFWPELEVDIHNPPHRWVEGVMGSAASPGDPVFYLHHCWIDMLWVRWQLAHPGAPFVSSGAGVGLNDPLMEWPDRTPAHVLDHHALGYSYDTEVPAGRVMIADFGDGNPPAEVRYWENWGQSPLFNGWHDAGDLQLVGDFRGLGRDQLLFINRGGSGGRVMIADFGDGNPPAEVRYWENWGQSPLFNGWHDDGDIQLVGDFMGSGRDHVLFINRGGSGGRVMIADFGDGNPPAEVRYWENWGQSPLFNGWHDVDDLWFAGDFTGLGRDQVLFINRGGSGGRVMIADFGDGNPPAEVRYWENWGQSPLFNGWHDAGDLQLVGDFRGLGRDQLLFINRGGSGGRVMIADFGDGNPPAEVRYWENWGQSPLFNGWHDAGDLQLVGDFRGLGRDQLLFINRGGSGGRVMIADFGDGNPPAEVRYWENWGQSNLLNGWHDADDLQMVGDFMGSGRQQVLFLNRTP